MNESNERRRAFANINEVRFSACTGYIDVLVELCKKILCRKSF